MTDPDNTQLLTTRLNLSTLYAGLGEYQRAADLQQQVLPAMRRVYGEDHPFTLQAAGNLASSLSSIGRHREAYEENRRLVERLLRVQGANALLTLYTRANLAYEAGMLGRREEAETGLRDVIDRQLQSSGPQHRNTIISETLLGRLLVQWNSRPAAIPLFEAALAGSRAGSRTESPDDAGSAAQAGGQRLCAQRRDRRQQLAAPGPAHRRRPQEQVRRLPRNRATTALRPASALTRTAGGGSKTAVTVPLEPILGSCACMGTDLTEPGVSWEKVI